MPEEKWAKGTAPFAPSPLLAARDPRIKLHFEIDADGEMRSPEVPPADRTRNCRARPFDEERLDQNRERLAELAESIDRQKLLAELSRASSELARSPVKRESHPARVQSEPREQVAFQVSAERCRVSSPPAGNLQQQQCYHLERRQ